MLGLSHLWPHPRVWESEELEQELRDLWPVASPAGAIDAGQVWPPPGNGCRHLLVILRAGPTAVITLESLPHTPQETGPGDKHHCSAEYHWVASDLLQVKQSFFHFFFVFGFWFLTPGHSLHYQTELLW